MTTKEIICIIPLVLFQATRLIVCYFLYRIIQITARQNKATDVTL